MTELIAALEVATKGNLRKLDYAIAREIGWTPPIATDGWRDSEGRLHSEGPPPFTESLDVALTLVPENLFPYLKIYDRGVFGAHAFVLGPSHSIASDCKTWGEAHLKPKKTDSYRRAIELWPRAVCIAALRARMAQE